MSNPKKESQNDMLTLEEAASVVAIVTGRTVHPNTVRNWIKRGLLPEKRLGFGKTTPYLIRRGTLIELLKLRDRLIEFK